MNDKQNSSSGSKKDSFEVLRPSWAAHGRVWAGFSTRHKGVSSGPFSSLNFSRRWPEDLENVKRNLDRLAAHDGFDPERVVMARQVHKADGICCDGLDPTDVRKTEADFLVAGEEGLVVSVITADCVPLLFWDPEARCVGAAHAGWRGVIAGVVQACVKAMIERYGARAEAMEAAVGPAIGSCCFEVGSDVALAFEEAFSDREDPVRANAMARPRSGGKAMVDLVGAVNVCLARAGLSPKKVEVLSPCTCCDPRRFFSYRRDGPRIGQHLSYIGLCGTDIGLSGTEAG